MEAAAFCNLIAYLLEANGYSLVLGAMFALGLSLGFPTHTAFHAWSRKCRGEIDVNRHLVRHDAVSER